MGSYQSVFEIETKIDQLTQLETDVLVLPIFPQEVVEDDKEEDDSDNQKAPTLAWQSWHQAIDSAMGHELTQTAQAEKFSAGLGKKRIFRPRSSDGIKARWVVLLGLGSPDKLDVQKVLKAFKGAVAACFGHQDVHHISMVLLGETAKVSTLQWTRSAVIAATQSTYKTKEAGEKKIHELKRVTLIPAQGSLDKAQLEIANAMAHAEALTKDLANMPANIKMAETLAEAARDLSKEGLAVTVLDDVDTIKKEMPAFYAVAQASAASDPPRYITVRYSPKGAVKKKIALVGKGVIFDTGGVQVKTGNYMNDMKFDMTGAASVLGVLKAVAALKLPNIEVTAYIAATRNAISDTAYLPDSIINTANGKKIEIRHTDAEGRVTLADSVHKATLDKPDELVTIATLTGSASMAVGHCIALMGTDDDLVKRLDTAAEEAGETVQSLKMREEDFDAIKSDRDAADLSNTSKAKGRGHLSAGAFVLTFAGKIPAAHMDIAGGDAKDGNATGIAVKGLIAYLLRESAT